MALTDPRVKIVFPNFSQIHTQALAMVVGWLGLSAGEVIPLDRSQLDRGLQHTSGRECLPLPICIGQLLAVHENRQPGEIAGFFMRRRRALRRRCLHGLPGTIHRRAAVARPVPVQSRGGKRLLRIRPVTLAKHISPAILVADILVEIEHVLHVVGAEGSVEQFRAEWERFVATSKSLDQFHAELPGFVARLAALPRTRDPLTCPRVVVTGDFFTRFSPFFMEGVASLYADTGIILKPVDLSDLSLYVAYHSASEPACGWGMKPGCLATAKACTRIFQPEGQEYLQNWLAYQAERRYEAYYRGLFRKTGLLSAGPKDVSSLFEKAAEHVSPTIFGEVIPTLDEGLEAESKGYDGVILIGPFNCLPFRISEAILKPLCIQQGMPILTYESDGYAVSPSFLRQVDVHIQQVLDHAARTSESARTVAGAADSPGS